MTELGHKQICLIVTGGIAAYKAPDLVRRFRDAGALVRVVMTKAAREFVQPLTFQAVSGYPVRCDLLDTTAEAAMGHIELARWADLVVVAPASADFLARLAHGLADDLATTLCLATQAKILVAPAMNQMMWKNAATQANLDLLRSRAVQEVGPEAGSQACGEVGPGRMAEPNSIVAAAAACFTSHELSGLRCLITAGPTQEPVDPVRYITNHSSGKMGYAVARATLAAGADVTLVTGPTNLSPPHGVTTVQVTSAADMHQAVMSRVNAVDIFIGTAAVADYTVEAPAAQKVKKKGAALNLTLAPTQDILRSVAALPHPPFTVGFAAETHNLLEYARSKLVDKAVNMIAANLVGVPGSGFASDHNELHVVWPGGDIKLGLTSKDALARQLVSVIAERYRAATTRR